LAGAPGGRAAEKPAATAAPASALNQLSAKEKAAGWRLLFDGKSMKGWRLFKGDKFPDRGWLVKDGILEHEKSEKFGIGDIVTEEEFDNFELKLEFRLPEAGNSGIKYLVDESIVKEGNHGVAFEFQLLDDAKHPDAKKGKDGNRTCGSLYDLIPAAKDKVVRPIGEWNEALLIVNGNHIEHWLNGKKVLAYERGSEALKALIAESKYKTIAGFGEARKGRILLQDHNDAIAFRTSACTSSRPPRPPPTRWQGLPPGPPARSDRAAGVGAALTIGRPASRAGPAFLARFRAFREMCAFRGAPAGADGPPLRSGRCANA
jgi:hypothetical protein